MEESSQVAFVGEENKFSPLNPEKIAGAVPENGREWVKKRGGHIYK